jgi:response regulator RpfG family c-di-GMP phosphodiesterase
MNRRTFIVTIILFAVFFAVITVQFNFRWQDVSAIAAFLLAPFRWLWLQFTESETAIAQRADERLLENSRYMEDIRKRTDRYAQEAEQLDREAERLRRALERLRCEEQTIIEHYRRLPAEETERQILERFAE